MLISHTYVSLPEGMYVCVYIYIHTHSSGKFSLSVSFCWGVTTVDLGWRWGNPLVILLKPKGNSMSKLQKHQSRETMKRRKTPRKYIVRGLVYPAV